MDGFCTGKRNSGLGYILHIWVLGPLGLGFGIVAHGGGPFNAVGIGEQRATTDSEARTCRLLILTGSSSIPGWAICGLKEPYADRELGPNMELDEA